MMHCGREAAAAAAPPTGLLHKKLSDTSVWESKLLSESTAPLQQNSNAQIPPGLTNVNKDPERHQRETDEEDEERRWRLYISAAVIGRSIRLLFAHWLSALSLPGSVITASRAIRRARARQAGTGDQPGRVQEECTIHKAVCSYQLRKRSHGFLQPVMPSCLQRWSVSASNAAKSIDSFSNTSCFNLTANPPLAFQWSVLIYHTLINGTKKAVGLVFITKLLVPYEQATQSNFNAAHSPFS
ncbi:hypothetical protein E3U43_013273 [Larimichthys crocea]|uniref:Uncharacterized protein n=1 Tax=Larimichthys crocea TaxID=215358 RepID=A0ACD3R9B3_LARCR|nr:hypothetical protein E3U43_013273 [Larimichthys crocea]